MKSHVIAWYRQQFSYAPASGVLTRIAALDSHGNLCPCSYVVAAKNSKGYLTVRVAGTTMRVHRLIWEIYYGVPAPEQIDHINHVRDDNRLENLRAADAFGNAQNRSFRRRPGCPYRGVYFERESGFWRAVIRVRGKNISLGRHACPEIAAHRYNVAAVANHGQFAQLNFIGGHYEE